MGCVHFVKNSLGNIPEGGSGDKEILGLKAPRQKGPCILAQLDRLTCSEPVVVFCS